MVSGRRRIAALGLAAATGLGCASCASSAGGTSDAAKVAVVASTDVYGNIAEQIAGGLAGTTVTITSIISDPDADPHSYEANTRTQLEISKADVIIENGGGYDDFVDTMRDAASSDAKVLNVVDLSGKTAPAGGELNEHVWYDFPTVEKLADALAAALGAADPDDASTFRANAATFNDKVDDLAATEAAIKAADSGAGVAITEPVPLYLLDACGLVNETPPDFSEAIEEGTDVPPAVLQQTLDLFNDKKVQLLAYNEQTSGAETERVLAAAKSNGIAVVPVTETLPDGKDYLDWMAANLAAVKAALA